MKIANNEWSATRNLKSKHVHHVASLKDSHGGVVDPDQNAELLAKYFEQMHWALRYIELLPVSFAEIRDSVQ